MCLRSNWTLPNTDFIPKYSSSIKLSFEIIQNLRKTGQFECAVENGQRGHLGQPHHFLYAAPLLGYINLIT